MACTMNIPNGITITKITVTIATPTNTFLRVLIFFALSHSGLYGVNVAYSLSGISELNYTTMRRGEKGTKD